MFVEDQTSVIIGKYEQHHYNWIRCYSDMQKHLWTTVPTKLHKVWSGSYNVERIFSETISSIFDLVQAASPSIVAHFNQLYPHTSANFGMLTDPKSSLSDMGPQLEIL